MGEEELARGEGMEKRARRRKRSTEAANGRCGALRESALRFDRVRIEIVRLYFKGAIGEAATHPLRKPSYQTDTSNTKCKQDDAHPLHRYTMIIKT